MGLDNGICVRRTEQTEKIRELQRFNQSYDKEHEFDFEVVYYRKCWNVRNAILSYLGKRWADGWKFTLSIDDIDGIIEVLKSFNADNWCDGGGSIWEWDEMKPRLRQHIKDLRRLKKIMKKHDIEVYFYDSY